jgi:hypothetical protein
MSGSTVETGLALELLVKERGPGVGLLGAHQVRAIADGVEVEDRGHHPELGLGVVRPDLTRDLGPRLHLLVLLEEHRTDAVPVRQIRGGDGLHRLGDDHCGQTLGNDLPAVVGIGAGEELGLGVGKDGGLARHRADAGFLLEVVEDALLNRDREADRPQLFLRETLRPEHLWAQQRR